MIKNIVFDMGNVLVRYDPDFFMQDLTAEEQALFSREIYLSKDWQQLDRGDLTEEELTARICRRIPAQYHATAKRLIQWYRLTEPIAGMDELVGTLKAQGYRIYLLSNTSLAFRSFHRSFPVLSRFDGLFISAEHRLLKPDPAIFHLFCQTHGVQPQDCVFIDDSPLNVQAAHELGFTAILFDGDAAKLNNTLSALQLLD